MSEDDVRAAIGSDTSQLAQQATDSGLSTAARLNQTHQDDLRTIKNQLNARGLLNSGEAGYQLDKENTGYAQAQFDARSKLLGYLADYQKGFLQGQQARTGQLTQGLSDAATRQYGLNQGSAGGTATLDHVASNGVPVYRGPDGRLYGPDGTPWVEPSPQTTQPAPPVAPPVPNGGNPNVGYQQTPRNGGVSYGAA